MVNKINDYDMINIYCLIIVIYLKNVFFIYKCNKNKEITLLCLYLPYLEADFVACLKLDVI